MVRRFFDEGETGRKGKRARERATHTITRALHARSKPGLALPVLAAANQPGPSGVPPSLRR